MYLTEVKKKGSTVSVSYWITAHIISLRNPLDTLSKVHLFPNSNSESNSFTMKFFGAIAISIMLVSSASSAKIVRREEHESSGKKQPIRKLGDDSDDSSDETDSPTLSPTVSPTLSPTVSPTLSPTVSPTLSPNSKSGKMRDLEEVRTDRVHRRKLHKEKDLEAEIMDPEKVKLRRHINKKV